MKINSHKSAEAFKLWNFNSDSLPGKFDELLIRIRSSNPKPHAIAISETWFNTETIGNYEIKGYSMFRRDRKSGRGGGVILYVRSNLNPISTKVLNKNPNNHEYLWVRLTFPNQSIYVCSLYIPPGGDPSIFSCLSNCIDHLNSLKNNPIIVITGDFDSHNNVWLNSKDGKGNPSTNPLGVACEDFCSSLSFTQMVPFPTHDTDNIDKPNMYSCIDLVLTNKPNKFVSVSCLPPLGKSRHDYIKTDCCACC